MHETPPPIAVIALQGEYDASRRDELLATLQAVPISDILIIDMRQVTHVDAAVLACFVDLKKRIGKSGKGIVRIFGLKPSLYEVFKIAGFPCSFEIFESMADAMGEFGFNVKQSVSA